MTFSPDPNWIMLKIRQWTSKTQKQNNKIYKLIGILYIQKLHAFII